MHAQDHAERHLATGNDPLDLTTLLANLGGNGLTITNGVLAVNVDGVTLEISADSLRIKDLGVSTAKIANAAVTETQLATSVAGSGLAGGGGTALSVGVDDSTIEINSDALRVKDAGITEPKMASGLSVCQIVTSGTRPGSPVEGDFIRETDTNRWAGYTGSAWRYFASDNFLVSGRHSDSHALDADDTGTISFGVTFASAPHVVGTAQVGSNIDLVLNWTADATTTGQAFRIVQKDNNTWAANYWIDWFAFGPLI